MDVLYCYGNVKAWIEITWIITWIVAIASTLAGIAIAWVILVIAKALILPGIVKAFTQAGSIFVY